MNTEPVKTALRGIVVWIAAAAAIAQAAVVMLNQLLVQLDAGTLSSELSSSIVTFVVIVVGIVKPLLTINELREKVTPWDPEIGAMSPAPTAPVADSADAGG